MTSPASRSRARSRAALLVPAFGLGLLACGAIMLVLSATRETVTVSAMHREVQRLAETRGDLGPWRIAAGRIDRLTGVYHDFTISSRQVHLGARQARLVIDADADTMRFELEDVVLTHAPEDADSGLVELPTYSLGPIPIGRDVVRDGGAAPVAERPALAGADR